MDEREKQHWRSLRRSRPREIVVPGPGQESVWDYPRPPRLEASRRRVRVELGGRILAASHRALRVCETASPPAYYVPPEDVRAGSLLPALHHSDCEWKGAARYWNVRLGARIVSNVAWSYPAPEAGFEALRDHLAFHPGRVDGCFLDGVRVTPQAGEFYGGWITAEIVGPFKGGPGSEGW